MTSQVDIPVTHGVACAHDTDGLCSGPATTESKPAPGPLRARSGTGQHRRAARRAGPAGRCPTTRRRGWSTTALLAPAAELDRGRSRIWSAACARRCAPCWCTTPAARRPSDDGDVPAAAVAARRTARADCGDDGEVRLSATGDSVSRAAGRTAADHARRPAGRQLGATEGLRERRMPVGVLRPVAQPRRHLVRDVQHAATSSRTGSSARDDASPRTDAGSQVDRCHTRAAASAPSPFSDQCSAIGAIRLPLRRRSQVNTKPGAPPSPPPPAPRRRRCRAGRRRTAG